MKKKILILGSSSFSGASTVNYLLNKNSYQIFGTYRKKKRNCYLPYKYNKKKKNFRQYKIDFLKNSNNLINIIKKVRPEVIIDFASICMVNESWKNSGTYFQINVLSKTKMIEFLSNSKFLKKYIYISTPEIFGSSKKYIDEKSSLFSPQTPYATSKLSFENLLKNYEKNFGFPLIISRFSNFYGPGQPLYRLIPKLINCVDYKKKFTLQGNGLSKRNFIFSNDFSSGIEKMILKGKIGKTYHFSGKKFYSVNDIIRNVCDLKSYDKKKLVKKIKSRVGQDFIYKLGSNMTMRELNWKPVYTLKKGLQEIMFYHKKYLNIFSKKDLLYQDKQLKK
tara:strand:+ start:924 stop:1928 length:1005 start_codon:yes stop_codon:yes gene_type:complete